MQQPSTPSPPAVHSANTPQPTPTSVSSISQPATPTPQQSVPPQSNQQNPATPNGGATPQQQQTTSTQQHVASSPQQFCLRWNNYQSNLTNVFDQLLQSESFVDVTLACDGHSVKAHKMVLSACSPYFQSLFFDNPCQHPIVIMRDIKWPELKAAVEFMYKGEINVSQDQIGPLLKVAESLKIRGLADVNGEPDLSSAELTARPTKISTGNLVDWDSPPSHHHRSSSSHHNMDTLDNHHNHHNMHHHHHHRSKKRRRVSGERSSLSSPAESACTDVLEGPNMPPSSSSVELTSPAPASTMQTNSGNAGGSITPQLSAQMQVGTSNASAAAAAAAQAALNAAMQGGGNDVGGAMSSLSGLSQMSHHQQPPHPPPQIGHVTDDLEIKPGIAEMIREEERAKLLESSHAWLGASTSSIAASANADFPTLLKLKTPTWNQDQLKEAIEAVVKQKMRFTQASSKYGIPKGTLYDNILGKSKRMAVLEEAGLTLGEENLVLEYCCEVSASPYNRRTKKSLTDVINYVLKLRRQRDPEFLFSGLSGFRWWWAFCKKHSIVSLFYENKDADSYQYQLQSMWQKCWNTNQSLVHNLRFRERGPLKSWRPETMAEAIFSVLKEGLSLSQAARKYDIPYPTFVLYANRVHNMLGPSADGGSDLRPKGRGRPQRILLGVWPDDHIRGVIRAVVFRDSNQIKEESHMGYPRLHDGVSIQSYQTNSSSNGSESTVSPGAAAAAAVAAVAHGLRQQMCSMVAAAQQHAHDTTSPVANLVNSLALAGHCGTVPMPNCGSIPNLPPNVANCAGGGGSSSASSNGGMNQLSLSHMASMRIAASPAGSIHDLRISPANSALESPISSPLGLTVTTQQSGGQQSGQGQHGNSPMDTALNLGMNSSQNPNSALDVSIGSGMTYKPSRSYTSPRPDSIFQDDIDELVKPMHHHHHHQSQQQQLLAAAGHLMAQHQSSLNSSAVAARAAALAAATGGVGVNVKDPANAGLVGIKLEPMTTGECRSD